MYLKYTADDVFQEEPSSYLHTSTELNLAGNFFLQKGGV